MNHSIKMERRFTSEQMPHHEQVSVAPRDPGQTVMGKMKSMLGVVTEFFLPGSTPLRVPERVPTMQRPTNSASVSSHGLVDTLAANRDPNTNRAPKTTTTQSVRTHAEGITPLPIQPRRSRNPVSAANVEQCGRHLFSGCTCHWAFVVQWNAGTKYSPRTIFPCCASHGCYIMAGDAPKQHATCNKHGNGKHTTSVHQCKH